MKRVLRKVAQDEYVQLQILCKKVYSICFANHWEKDGLNLYLEEQFGSFRLIRDLKAKSLEYFYILDAATPIGFLKINYEAILEGFEIRTTSELEKMYIFPGSQGKGIGKTALQNVMGILRDKEKKVLFLEVLDSNENAIRFYQRLGFEFHSKKQLTYPNFKEEIRGLDRMYRKL